MVEIATFTVRTVTGTDVPVTIRTNEIYDRTLAYAEVGGRSGELANGAAYAVPTKTPEPQHWYKRLHDLGATHYARIGVSVSWPSTRDRPRFSTPPSRTRSDTARTRAGGPTRSGLRRFAEPAT